ncbi:hypothetical protein LTR86_000823 [Recurvomyces mirabilis]|nr:hypothetical protein LTR86_000823 [Recurvomyces mirabilis]
MAGSGPGTLRFEHDDSIREFAVSKQEYLKQRPDADFTHIATSVLVVSESPGNEPRILLLQRAASDWRPNKWEPPGGAYDDEDLSILHGAARELWEETGLEVFRFTAVVGEPFYFELRSGRKVARLHFAARIKVEAGAAAFAVVRLSPAEHQHFMWASEDEIMAGRTGTVDLVFTNDHIAAVLVAALKHCNQPLLAPT